MATLPVQSAGEVSYQDADPTGDRFENDGRTYIWFDNQLSPDITVTFLKQRPAIDPDPQVIPRTQVVPGLSRAASKACEPGWFNVGGFTYLTYSSVVGLKVAAVRIPNAQQVP